MEILVGCEALRDQLASNHLSIFQDEATARPKRKQHAGDSRHEQRIRQPEQNAITIVKRIEVPHTECAPGPPEHAMQLE